MKLTPEHDEQQYWQIEIKQINIHNTVLPVILVDTQMTNDECQILLTFET